MNKNWFFRNIANLITLLGFIMCFVILWLVIQHRDWTWMIFWLVIAAFLTDLLDGPIARRLHTVSKFGSAADRLRDKFLQLIMFSFFILDQRVDPWLKGITFPLAIIEIGLLVIWVMGVVKKFDVAASKWGKWKMFLISIGIIICLIGIIADQFWGLESSSFLVPVLFLMFAASLFLGAKSFKTHVSKYRAQLICPQK